ncbi:MAG TPA: hypothetical protein VD903_11770, partial [Pseudonocardia sp.]|nr:hypothetical protein [Pseudonocardia sp.]
MEPPVASLRPPALSRTGKAGSFCSAGPSGRCGWGLSLELCVALRLAPSASPMATVRFPAPAPEPDADALPGRTSDLTLSEAPEGV